MAAALLDSNSDTLADWAPHKAVESVEDSLAAGMVAFQTVDTQVAHMKERLDNLMQSLVALEFVDWRIVLADVHHCCRNGQAEKEDTVGRPFLIPLYQTYALLVESAQLEMRQTAKIFDGCPAILVIATKCVNMVVH